jgi:phage tail-like protein
MADEMADMPLLRAFRFRITLRRSPGAEEGAQPPADLPTGTPLGNGAFQDCTGLEIEMDVQNYQEGGRNDGVIQRVGRGKYQNIVLKRGMFFGDPNKVNTDLWQWMQDVVSGVRPVARYDGVIEVMSVGFNVAATWVFERGLPAHIRGPELNAKTGEVAIEELHIAHEGLRLVV